MARLEAYIKEIIEVATRRGSKEVDIEVNVTMLYEKGEPYLIVDPKSTNKLRFTIPIGKEEKKDA